MIFFILVINVIFMLCLSARCINYIQLNSYKFKFGRRELSHYIRVVLATLIGVIVMLVIGLFDNLLLDILSIYLFFLPLLILIGIDWFKRKKTPLVITSRVVRLFIVLTILYAGLSLGLNCVEKYVNSTLGRSYWIGYLLLPLIIRLGMVINSPLENAIKSYYFRRAVERLKERDGLIRIGITGSYGKTTVKNILAKMLEKNYKVLASPHSYNTPMGFAKTIENLTDDTQIMIMEIGARHRGDVRKIAEVLKPNVGIITGIAPCHLESFGDIDNIILTKSELLEYLQSDGIAVFNGANVYTSRMYELCGLNRKELVRFSSGTAVITDLVTSVNGSEFTLHIGNRFVECKTKLIGEHNIQNILMAVTVASLLGVDIEDIASSIYELESVPHRLEMTHSNGITILDDSYNANPVSVQASLRTLALFKERKVAICQGMVELGSETFKENYELGVKMSGVVDLAILVGAMGKIIKKGLIDSGYNPTRIVEYDNLAQATKHFGETLRYNDVLLIMNDLPDNY